MQRLWRQMFAAVLGVVVVAGVSAAQSPPPQPLPPIIAIAAPVAVPVSGSGFAVPDIMPTSGGLPGASALRGEGIRGVISQPAVAYGEYGAGCNSGCGSCKSDAGFMFGSCKSYFDPCGPKACSGLGRFGKGGRCGGGLCDRCPPAQFGQPYGTGYNGCKYDSWLNH